MITHIIIGFAGLCIGWISCVLFTSGKMKDLENRIIELKSNIVDMYRVSKDKN